MSEETLKLAREQAWRDLHTRFAKYRGMTEVADILDDFAKQIARECAEIAEQTAREVGGRFWETHMLNAGLLKAIAAIRAKFGI